MPLTLDKLFSATVSSSFVVLGETVHLTWCPSKYTGEMDDLAREMQDEETADILAILALEEAGDTVGARALAETRERRNAAAVRRFLSEMLVAWDVMDGTVPHPHDEAGLNKLPAWLVTATFVAMSEENQTDPMSDPSSDEPSGPKASSGRSRPGTPSSGARKSSEQPRGK